MHPDTDARKSLLDRACYNMCTMFCGLYTCLPGMCSLGGFCLLSILGASASQRVQSFSLSLSLFLSFSLSLSLSLSLRLSLALALSLFSISLSPFRGARLAGLDVTWATYNGSGASGLFFYVLTVIGEALIAFCDSARLWHVRCIKKTLCLCLPVFWPCQIDLVPNSLNPLWPPRPQSNGRCSVCPFLFVLFVL